MNKYILSLDAGTTSNRAILFDHDGQIVDVAQEEFEQIFPKPGWVEHDPEEIWETQLRVIKKVLANNNLTHENISGIGITNQRETVVVWNRSTGKPIHNAIVWQDRRTSAYCDQLKAKGMGSTIQEKTGLVIDAYFSGSKIRWMLENVEGARSSAESGELAFGTVDSWLIWKLTEGKLHVTDVTNASRTLLYNIHDLKWDSDLMDLLEVPGKMLPEVKASSEVYGSTDAEILGGEIPIAGIAGDQQAALFGQMCIEPGMSKNTYGTGCFVIMNTGTEAVASKNNLLTTIAWQIGDSVNYALEGSIFIGGAIVQWLRDQLKIIDSAPQVEELAASVEDNGGVYFVPAFVGLGAPHWDQYAAGTIVGLTRGSGRPHIARAALEAIALQSADVIHTMSLDSGISTAELRVDGGAAVNNLLMQIQADVIQSKVTRPKIVETTALGAAYLAGLAVGYWSSLDEIRNMWEVDQSFEPKADSESTEKLKKQWNKALERSMNWFENE